MTYDESVQYLFSLGRELASPRQASATKFDLKNITVVCEHLGQPQREFQSVHVAGTNGKGSTSAMLDSILRAAGLRTGLYTSPHLERINERIRLDATNILLPEVAVITQIDFDHENYLGHSIEEIAGEKAGIIKPGARVVSAAEHLIARVVIRRRCAEQSAFLVEIENAYFLEDVTAHDGCFSFTAISYDSNVRIPIALRLPGRFQGRNALTALAAARRLAERGAPIDDEAITRGFAAASWPGRLERISERPEIYVDGTPNPAGAREIAVFWEQFLPGRNIVLIYGAMRDKAVDEIAGLLFPRASTVILTSPAQPRAISAAVLEEMTGHHAQHA